MIILIILTVTDYSRIHFVKDGDSGKRERGSGGKNAFAINTRLQLEVSLVQRGEKNGLIEH